MGRSATQILEQGKARRGGHFHSVLLLYPDGGPVMCGCGGKRWRRRPDLDVGRNRSWECAGGCGVAITEALNA